MSLDFFKRLLALAVLLLAQVLVFNRIRLFDCATPLLYVYFVIALPRQYPRWASLLWSFTLGMLMDMFANTPGMAMTSLTLLGFIQPMVIEWFIPRDADEKMKASAKQMGWNNFLPYSSVMVFAYCLVFSTVEAFNFFNWLHWLLSIIGSTAVTLALILALENFRSSNGKG